MQILLLTLLLTVAADMKVTVLTTDGPPMEGTLATWSATALTLQSAEQSQKFSAEKLLRIRWSSPASISDQHGKYVKLVDGTRIPIERYVVSDGTATFSTPFAKTPLNIPTSQIHWVQLKKQTQKTKTLLAELREKPWAGDVLVIQKSGSERVDHLTGVVEDVSDKQVTFRWDEEVVPVKRSKVVAVGYYHAQLSELSQPICLLKTRNGAQIPVVRLAFFPKEIEVATPSGIVLRLPLKSLQSADYSHGKILYLSDMRPLSQRWTPRIALPEAAKLIRKHGMPRRDQSFTGSPLSLEWPVDHPSGTNGTQIYEKGLALRSRSEVVYRLPRNMRRLVAIAGIDPATLAEGDVTLDIFVDERRVWQSHINGKQAPIEIDVSLDGGKQMRIVVDYGNNLDLGDRLHLVQARLIK